MFNYLSRISLSSWDEAWYGVISRNIYQSGEYFRLMYNGNPFFDHPPFVFWLQVIAYSLFGVNDFAVRLPSVVLAIGTFIVTYLLGKEIFGRLTGIFAAIALLTSPWFLTRSLSGNLDIPLTFLFVTNFYLALRAGKEKRYLILLAITLGLLFLTKSLVPFTIIPTIIVLLWKKIRFRNLFLPSLIFLTVALPWFFITYTNYPAFIQKYLSIGYPGVSENTDIWQNVLLTKTYLHNGMGNWFYFGFAGLIAGLILYTKKYLAIAVFVFVFLFPFAFSNKGHIWHLIPLHPFWMISLFGFVGLANAKFPRLIRLLIMIALFMLISWTQIKRNWYEILSAASYNSDLELLATKSKEYTMPLYLDDDAVPEVVWYSEKDRVERVNNRGDIRRMFDEDRDFQLITRDWRLVEENIKSSEYTLVAKDRDKVLILKK